MCSRLFIVLVVLSFVFSFSVKEMKAQKIEFIGTTLSPIKITPKKESGLTNIFVLDNSSNVGLRIEASEPDRVNISNFTMLGAAFATPVDNIVIRGKYITVPDLIGDSGYMVEDGSKVFYFWIVDYSKHNFNIESISLSTESGCDETVLDINGNADAINYYTINGKKETLSRDIIIEYNNLVFNENTLQFEEKKISGNFEYFLKNIIITPPVLCATDFVVTGDRFLSEWNISETLRSETFLPTATKVYTTAIEENRSDESYDSSNRIPSGSENLGGSAPAEISFRSYVSDAVIHNEWQIANDEDFEDIIYRFTEPDLNYTFTKEGTIYVRFIGSNNDGSCQSIGDTYTVSIGASALFVPNAFSPNGDGINDIWKVSYKSLISFKCWIFNKQGHEIYQFENPDGGWDGKKDGKLVKSGVYYYVIQATGSDGKKYRKRGDINIINSKNLSNSNDY